MRKITGFVLMLAGTFVLFGSPVAESCGDKLLSIARGIRLQQAYKARHPASILLYVGNLEGANKKALVQMSILYMSLRQAGHALEVVQNESELSKAVKKQRFDFLMADLKDVGVVNRHASNAEVLPVLFKPKKTDFASAQAQYKVVLKTPIRSADHLEAIDRAMESRSAD